LKSRIKKRGSGFLEGNRFLCENVLLSCITAENPEDTLVIREMIK
jgi:hypothetical protein